MVISSAKFSKNKEDFLCQNCGCSVSGNGYTNHCPKCLYSKHVDINPGDRSSTCQALMIPVKLKKKGSVLSVLHKCSKCNFERLNKLSPDDNLEEAFKLKIY